MAKVVVIGGGWAGCAAAIAAKKAGADVLILDYSSLMFDFALTKKPCFLYVPDLDEYIENDRGLYFYINELMQKLKKRLL